MAATTYLFYDNFYVQESFNTNILHQVFDNTITFENSQHKNTHSKDDFVLKNRVEKRVKISGIQKKTQIWYDLFNS